LKINLIFEMLRDPVIIGILTFASTVAAVLAAYFSWKQLRVQHLRWATEEARSKPIIYLGCSPYFTEDKLIHGVWGVNNRESFQMELLKIEAVSPRTLQIGDLDPSNFLFRISDYPERYTGKRVRMRFTFREVDNPHLIRKMDATFDIPVFKCYEV
jgi:hypothetical protein